MGLNVDFLLDPELEDAHPQNDIRSIIWNIEVLDALAKKGSVTPLGEMGLSDGEDDEDYEDDEDDEVGDDEEDYTLFPVKDGIRTIEFLLNALRAKPKDPKEQARLKATLKSLQEGPELLIEELEEILACFRMAAKKAKFRFILV